MTEKIFDWSKIAKNPKFIKLHREKTAFLIGLWMLGAVSYLLLTMGAAYAPVLFKTRIIGRMNVGYVFCMFQFVLMIAILAYYTIRANNYFDPLKKDLINDIERGN